jgi:hypothetical protein
VLNLGRPSFTQDGNHRRSKVAKRHHGDIPKTGSYARWNVEIVRFPPIRPRVPTYVFPNQPKPNNVNS